MNLLQRVIGRLASATPGNAAVRLDQGPLCSFTFDDCHRSSMTVGGKMLEEAGAGGTFYVAGSMALEPGSHPMVTGADLAELTARGHEIGCHTYSHTSVVGRRTASLAADAERNFAALSAHTNLEGLHNFSYPFGEVSFAAKRYYARRFASSRGLREGLNYKVIDLAELRACRIFDNSYSRERIRNLVARCKEKSAWLIFYTHDVDPNPSPWGCKPEQFRETLQAVQDAGIDILTMRAAIGRVMFRRAA